MGDTLCLHPPSCSHAITSHRPSYLDSAPHTGIGHTPDKYEGVRPLSIRGEKGHRKKPTQINISQRAVNIARVEARDVLIALSAPLAFLGNISSNISVSALFLCHIVEQITTFKDEIRGDRLNIGTGLALGSPG